MRVTMMGSYPVYGFARELGVDPKALQRVTSWNETLAATLAERDDLEVHLITSTKVIPRTRTVQRGRLKVTYFVSPPRMNMLTLFQYTRWQVHKLLDEIDPDVVHGIGTEHLWPYVAITSRFPAVVTVHGVMSEIVRKIPPSWLSQRRLFAWLERWVLKRTRHLIVINPYAASVLGRYTSARTYPVENATRELFFDQCASPQDGKYILFVGSIERRKALDVLIDALAQLRSKTEGTAPVLVIVGPVTEPQYGVGLRQHIADLGLKDSVQFRGFLLPGELAGVYAGASLLVLSSLEETAPACITEAMAAGLPVVATRVGGVSYMVSNGETGFLVEPGDVETLAARIETLWHDPELRKQMGNRSKVVARERWWPAMIAEQTIQVYQRVLETAK